MTGGLFQSTRPSRASTPGSQRMGLHTHHFNPQGPRGPRLSFSIFFLDSSGFQSTRPSRASTDNAMRLAGESSYFNPQGPRGPRRTMRYWKKSIHSYFNPQGPRGPRRWEKMHMLPPKLFQSTRPSRASTCAVQLSSRLIRPFQSTRPSRASTLPLEDPLDLYKISIHKALAGLDIKYSDKTMRTEDFNPQGPRGPRRRYTCCINI